MTQAHQHTQTRPAGLRCGSSAAADGERPVRDHTLALTLSYNGAPFSGFARQPGQLTVQGDVEAGAARCCSGATSRRRAPAAPTRACMRSARW